MPVKTPASTTAALLLVLAPLSLATAQTSGSPYVFETVNSIEAQAFRGTFKITGLLQDEAAPRTLTFNASAPANAAEPITRICERYALVAMSNPGQYYLEVRSSGTLDSCKLTRR